ncbi:WxL domain-containing protein [Apilactobacillus timberlakei]|uniref:WxL domain-containing protein n=1 Tax=Apilactobacillus timberlakei TaxID=2008380 RepID=UPI001126789C|nr:WxL domain-containing protein [Apilactobacillus timberlakei]TPR19378.1 WxL domain-containing protein [Apilactobacillus timberlakei]
MKKLLLCTAALTMFAGSVLALNNSNVKADEGKTVNTSGDIDKSNDNNNQGMQNNGNSVKTFTYFKVDNSSLSTPAADPNNPGGVLNHPENHNVFNTGGTGELTIDAVPKELDFGQTPSSNNSSDSINSLLNFESENENAKYYYAQVSDHRNTDKHSGWFLTANMSNMSNLNGDGSTLKAANITLGSNDKPNTVIGAYDNNSNGENNNKNGVKTSNSIKLDSDSGNVGIMSADNNTGMGTWLNKFQTIALNAKKSESGSYKGTITWNLTDAPGTPGSTKNNVNTSNNTEQKTNDQ